MDKNSVSRIAGATAEVGGRTGDAVVELTREFNTVYGYGSEPNMTWVHVDSNGHRHAWGHGAVLPTLVGVSVPCSGVCGDPEHEELRYACRACGETVEPQRSRVWHERPVERRTVLRVIATFRSGEILLIKSRESVVLWVTMPAANDAIAELFGMASVVGDVHLTSETMTFTFEFIGKPASRGAYDLSKLGS